MPNPLHLGSQSQRMSPALEGELVGYIELICYAEAAYIVAAPHLGKGQSYSRAHDCTGRKGNAPDIGRSIPEAQGRIRCCRGDGQDIVP